MLDSMFADTPFGYTERLYSCPQAEAGWPVHTAAIEAIGGSVVLRRNEHGDYHCAMCKARIYPDTVRKMAFTLGFVIREEWL